MKSSISVIRISHLEEGVKKKVLLRGVFINRDTNGEGVLKVGTYTNSRVHCYGYIISERRRSK